MQMYYNGNQILNVPANINDTTASTQSTYSSSKIQGLVDTINTQKCSIKRVTQLPTDTTERTYNIFVLTQQWIDGATTYAMGVYIYFNDTWNKFDTTSIG